jgi:hypothetical protein
LQFGEQVPGAPASLPVKLAVALLADSRGVIDLDLPISGSLNDPQFSLGPIIIKAIFNLIGKAITAPFTLLAHAFSGGGGGADDLSQVAFAPGSAALTDATRAQLDKIAKAMADRPSIKITVAGSARLDEEREALKRERLQTLVAAERRAGASSSAPRDKASAPAAETPDDAPAPATADSADYPQLLARLYRRADIPGKPRNLIGLTKDVPVAEMESLLLASISVSDNDIRQLATQRAVAVKDYLLAQKLSADRVFIGAEKPAGGAPSAATPGPSDTSPARWTPHAELQLGA